MRRFVIILALLFTGFQLFAQLGGGWQSDPNIYAQKKEANEFWVVSWNIKMLPRWVPGLHFQQAERAEVIGECLLKDKADVIVFQECFDVRARRILRRLLSSQYPYSCGPANPAPLSHQTNSGIVIYSKTPLLELGSVDFETCDGPDCLARKGGLLVETVFQGNHVQILGTHLEAGGTREMKISQYQQLRGLLDAHQVSGVPQLLCGDFNTHQQDTFLYPRMLHFLDAQNGHLSGFPTFTTGPNDMRAKRKWQKKQVIDYILLRKHDSSLRVVERSVRVYREKWSDEHIDLSDHFGVLGRFLW